MGFYSPRLMFKKYQPFTDYLTHHSGARWELVIKPTYEAIVAALCDGDVDVAYLGPFSYIRAHEQCGAVAVVQLFTDGISSFRSLLMVREDSAIHSLDDLHGRRIGFGSTLSTSSHLVPLSILERAGLLNGDIECIYFGNHERAIQALVLGEVDACGVRDLVGQRYLERGLRVLATSSPLPNFPLAVGPHTLPAVRQRVVHTLVELPRTSAAAADELATLDVEFQSGFATVTDAEYDGIRELARQVFGDQGWLGWAEDLRCARARTAPVE